MATRGMVCCGLAVLFLLASARGALAADLFFRVPVDSLLGPPAQADAPDQDRLLIRNGNFRPYAVITGGGEAYFDDVSTNDPTGAGSNLLIRVPHANEVTGELIVLDPATSPARKITIRIPAAESSPRFREQFLRAQARHYERLSAQDAPGAAWFRHRLRAVQRELGESDANVDANLRGRRQFFGQRTSNLEDTFALVSGGRALSENLQLDRLLPESTVDNEIIDIDSIAGITVREFDWKVADLHPQLDPLAAAIPHDQYAVLVPSFAALVALADRAGAQGGLVLNLAEPRSENARVRERYERQLGVSLNELTRALGPALVKSVALTGADPYLRTGADVALLLETTDPAVLQQLLIAQRRLIGNGEPDVQQVSGDVGNLAYTGSVTPDRRICSYLAVGGNVVIVTNSLAQLRRLADVANKESPSLASLPEFTFFRNRYVLGDPGETALLMISDATIRRWCGPRWRIGASRRTRAVAAMLDVQAEHLDQLVNGTVEPGPVKSNAWSRVTGNLLIDARGVRSDVYGTLDFQTPIVELDLAKVTGEEQRLYGLWRDGYQRAWSTYFDPIAVRFFAAPDSSQVDLSVMPLIDRSSYAEIANFSHGEKVESDEGDRHPEALLHFAMSLNRENELLMRNTNMFGPRLNPLGWIGDTLAIYVDDDPVLAEIAAAEDLTAALEAHAHRLPVGLSVEVSNGLSLTVFLTAVRTMIDQTAPGMLTWEALEHAGEPYVRIGPSARLLADQPQLPPQLRLYYAAGGRQFLLTLNESLLHRALEREAKRRDLAAGNVEDPAAPDAVVSPPAPWPGENFNLVFGTGALRAYETLFGEEFHRLQQQRAWRNLPILNEWKRLYPESDPVAVHRQFWSVQLVDPAGGEYRWNEEFQTMESTLFGHPGKPGEAIGYPEAFRQMRRGALGITFEEHGLRARVEIQHAPAAAR